MRLDVIENINEKIHIRDGVNYYMDYFTDKYEIKSCVIKNEKENEILYSKNKKDINKYSDKIVLRKNSYEEIDFYLDKEINFEKKNNKENLEILKLMVSNLILY